MTARYYPLEALVAASGLSEAAMARRCGLSGTTLKNARANGLRDDAADRHAVRLGFHPSEVWSDWFATEGYYGVPYRPVSKRDRTKNKDNAAVEFPITVQVVKRRLQASEGVRELQQLRGMSADELAILIAQETAASAPGSPQAACGEVAA